MRPPPASSSAEEGGGRRVAEWWRMADECSSSSSTACNLYISGGQIIPSELLHLILLKLPLPEIFRLRLVSHSWNVLLSSPAFLHSWSDSSHQLYAYWLTQSVSHAPFYPSPSHDLHAGEAVAANIDDPDGFMLIRGADDDVLWRLCRQSISHELSLLCLCMRSQQQRFLPLPRCRFRPQSLTDLVINHKEVDHDHFSEGVVTCGAPCVRHLAAGGGSLVAELAFYCSKYSPPLLLQNSDFTPSIRVFNLLTGRRRQLPIPSSVTCTSSLSNSIFFTHMEVGDWPLHRLIPRKIELEKLKSYLLHLLASDDGEHYHLVIQLPSEVVHLFVYDSRCPGVWRVVFGIFYRNVSLEEDLADLPQEVYHGHDIFQGDLFFPVVAKSLLFGYRVENDEWSRAKVELPFPSECFGSHEPTVMKLEGPRILMAVHLSTHDSCRSRKVIFYGFALWELQQEQNSGRYPIDSCMSQNNYCLYSWVEVARTPSTFSFLYDLPDPPRFLHSNRMICMTGEYHNHHDVSASGYMAAPKRYLRPLAYDLVRDCWSFMPYEWINSPELLILSSFQPSFFGPAP